MTIDGTVTTKEPETEELLEGIDKPIERLKLRSENDDEIAGSFERHELRRTRLDAERMVDALKAKAFALPAFLFALAVPLGASLGRATGVLSSTAIATAIGVVGMLLALAVSWLILRGAALASRRIRLATRGPLNALWTTIGSCGKPPKDQTRTFVIISIALTLGCWIIVPILVGIGLAE